MGFIAALERCRIGLPAVLWVMACAPAVPSPANSAITIGPYQLEPRSGLVYDSPDGGWSVVIVSDQPDVCGFYNNSLCSLNQVGPPPGNNLIMVFNGAASTPYAAYNAGAYKGAGGGAQAPYFLPDGPGGPIPPFAPILQAPPQGEVQLGLALTGLTGPVQFWAATGSATLQSLSANHAAGTYDVQLLTLDPTYNTLPTIRGNFSVSGCANLEAVSDFASLCSATATADGGSFVECACQGRTSSASCASMGFGPGSSTNCSCASSTNGGSTCSVGRNGPFTAGICCAMGVMADGGT